MHPAAAQLVGSVWCWLLVGTLAFSAPAARPEAPLVCSSAQAHQPAASCSVQLASSSAAAVTACLHAAVAGAAIVLWHLLLRFWQHRQRQQQLAQQQAASKLATVPAAVAAGAPACAASEALILAHVAIGSPKSVAASPFAAAPSAAAASPFAAASSAAAASPFAAAACQVGYPARSMAVAPPAAIGSPFAAFAATGFDACGSSRVSLEANQKQRADSLHAELATSVGACPTPPPHSGARQLRNMLDSVGASTGEPSLTDALRTPSGCLFAWAEAEAEAASLAALPFPTLDHARFLEAPALTPAALPPQLRGAVVPPCCVSILRAPDGSPQQLGSGASGAVYRATLRRDGPGGAEEVVAAKVIHVGGSAEAQGAFVKEALYLQSLQHRHLVGLRGIALDGPNAMLLLECCEGLDLLSSLQLCDADIGRLFGWRNRGRRVALELAQALAYLHSQGICHLDVKSANLLLAADGSAKLADMGFACALHSTNAPVGTFAWAAPELLLGAEATTAADIYSFGVCLYEIVTGELPVRGQLRMPHVPSECPQEVADLFVQCTSSNPGARPTAQELVQRLSKLA